MKKVPPHCRRLRETSVACKCRWASERASDTCLLCVMWAGPWFRVVVLSLAGCWVFTCCCSGCDTCMFARTLAQTPKPHASNDTCTHLYMQGHAVILLSVPYLCTAIRELRHKRIDDGELMTVELPDCEQDAIRASLRFAYSGMRQTGFQSGRERSSVRVRKASLKNRRGARERGRGGGARGRAGDRRTAMQRHALSVHAPVYMRA